MSNFIKEAFIVLLNFSSSLVIKYLPLNDKPCMIRPTFIDLNHVELYYYTFMIGLDKCNGSCNVLSPKVYVPKKTKDINVKLLIWQQIKNEAKTMAKHISCECKCEFSSTTCNWNPKWNDKTWQCERKNHRNSKKDYSWNSSTCACENRKYLKSIADDSLIACDEVIYVMDIASTKMKNTVVTNVTITILTNSEDKKVRHEIDYYLLPTVLLVIVLLFTIAIICYHYLKHWSKHKGIDALAI